MAVPSNSPFTQPAPPTRGRRRFPWGKAVLAIVILSLIIGAAVLIPQYSVIVFRKADSTHPVAVLRKKNKELRVENQSLARQVHQLENQNQKLAEQAGIVSPELEQKMAGLAEGLTAALRDRLAKDMFEISTEDREIQIRFDADVFFSDQSTYSHGEGRQILEAIAPILKESVSVRVESHVDDEPLTRALKNRFVSHWEYAAARSASIANDLTASFGVAAEKLSAVSLGNTQQADSVDISSDEEPPSHIIFVLSFASPSL